ncbi:dolichol kinase [Plakobranchus ocellatus]|uniref:dolichol kinase n=1 Tax=Plakobranchus ocellatus TaxID=259542 RepID=A0AAV4BL74_9GAST|nr:dolichol kinase [Plakobranchus ocellatus]
MQEQFYNVLASFSALYISYKYFVAVDELGHQWVIPGVVLIDVVMLFCLNKISKGSNGVSTNYRPAVSSGVFLSLIVPLTHMGELVALVRNEDLESMVARLWLSLASILPVAVRWLWVNRKNSMSVLLLLILSYGIIFRHLDPLVALSFLSTDFVVIWMGLRHIPVLLPKSFTFGELALVLQLLIGLSHRFVFGFLEKSWLAGKHFPLLLFIHTLLVTVIAATCVIYLTSAHSSMWKFISIYSIFAAAAFFFLQLILPENPLVWLIYYISDSCNRVFLIVVWLILMAITLIWVANQSLALDQIQAIKGKGCCNHQETSNSKTQDTTPVTTRLIARKMFHIFIVLVYVPGLMVDPHLLLLASIAVFGVFVVVEAARALQVPVMGTYINDMQKLFVDERDQGHVFLTHIYLLLGMSLPLWMSPSLLFSKRASPETYAGVLALGVGDTVACLTGRAFGKLQWPGSKKTIEGTTCSILVQMILGAIGFYAGVFNITSILTVSIGVTLTALAEAFTDQIDNLVLPLFLYPILCFS